MLNIFHTPTVFNYKALIKYLSLFTEVNIPTSFANAKFFMIAHDFAFYSDDINNVSTLKLKNTKILYFVYQCFTDRDQSPKCSSVNQFLIDIL